MKSMLMYALSHHKNGLKKAFSDEKTPMGRLFGLAIILTIFGMVGLLCFVNWYFTR